MRRVLDDTEIMYRRYDTLLSKLYRDTDTALKMYRLSIGLGCNSNTFFGKANDMGIKLVLVRGLW